MDAVTGRRAFLAGLGLTGLGLALGGCGFRPLYYQGGGEEVRGELAAIEVVGLSGRLGQHLRTGLLDEFNPQGAAVPQRYILAVRLRRTTKALAIQLDNTITRFNLTLIAQFQLLDREDRDVLYESSVRRISSYNVRDDPFATLSAELDAERRAAEELSSNISTMIAVHFQRQQARA